MASGTLLLGRRQNGHFEELGDTQMDKQVMHPGNLRLALRVEGHWWNAYAAPMNTMEGAVLLGSIGMGAVTGEGAADDASRRSWT